MEKDERNWKSKKKKNTNDYTPNKNDKLNYILNVHTPL